MFDVNTPYKHREILADNTFVYDLGDLFCVWQNTTDASLQTEIALDFFLRSGACYTRESEPPGETAQRAVYIAKRRCGRDAAVN